MECRVCHNELNDSNWNPSTKKFHSYICKKCDSQKKKAYYQLHKKESFEKGKQYRINNREKVNINGRNWRRRFRIGTRDLAGNKILIKCIKRPHTLICELCGEKQNVLFTTIGMTYILNGECGFVIFVT